ncbi:MAG: hypothetical protein WC974_09435 [Thermoplasmata archaeon]
METKSRLNNYIIGQVAKEVRQDDGNYIVGSYNASGDKIYVCADFITLWASNSKYALRFNRTDAKAIRHLLNAQYAGKSDIHFIEKVKLC